MAGVQIGALHISFSADSAAFEKGMDKVEDKSKEAAKKVEEDGERMSDAIKGYAAEMAASFAAAFTIANMADRIKEQIDYADSLADVAARSLQSAEALSAFEYALHFQDATLQDYTDGLQKMSQNIAAASEGAKEQSLIFETLGIEIRDNENMVRQSGEVMMEFANKLASMSDGATKTALAMDVLGKSAGPALLPFLSQGQEGIEEFIKEAERMGLVISTDFSDAAGHFNDNLDKITFRVKGLWRAMAEELTPALNDVSDSMLRINDHGKDQVSIFGDIAAAGIRMTGSVFTGLGEIYDLVTDATGKLMALGEKGAKAAFENPFGQQQNWKDFGVIWESTSFIDNYTAAINRQKTVLFGLSEAEKQAAKEEQNRAELDVLLTKFINDEAVKEYEAQKKRLAEQAADAEKAAKAREDAAKKAQAELEKQQAAVDKLAQSFMTEAEKENFFYEQQKNFLENANAKAFESANQRHQLLQQLETQHHQKIKEINDKAAADAQAKAIADANQRVAELLEDPIVTDIAYEAKVQNDDYKAQQEGSDLYDSLVVDENAKNAYKKLMHQDFITSFLTGEQDRINQAITMGDKELEARKAQMQATVGFFNQGLSQMAQGQGKAAKAAQAIQKAQALYEIGVNTYRAAMGAYAALSPIPFVGPALGVAAAAAAIAFGGSMAQGVLSGGSPSVTGGAPPALPASSSPTSQAEQRAEQPTLTTYVRIPEDAILTGRKLIDFIDEAVGDNKQPQNFRFIPA